MTDSVEDFSTMLRRALGERLTPQAVSFVEMIAENSVMEFPYAPPHLPKRLEGRLAVARHLAGLADLIVFDRMSEPLVHATLDPDLVILEFEGFGRGVSTGEPYEQSYISVIRTCDGRIVHYRDYWNPLAVLRALRGSSVIDALAGGTPTHD